MEKQDYRIIRMHEDEARAMDKLLAAVAKVATEAYGYCDLSLRTIDQWHEDLGDKLWWQFPISESPYVGSPLDDNWPGYHTHFTDIPMPAIGEDGGVLKLPWQTMHEMREALRALRMAKEGVTEQDVAETMPEWSGSTGKRHHEGA